jgi:WD40 repeat protein
VDGFGDPLPPGALARLGTVRFRHGAATSLAFSPDGKVLAVGGRDEGIRLYDPDTGRSLARHGGDENLYVTSSVALAFSPDGKRMAAAHGPVRLIDLASGRDLWRQQSDTYHACTVALSPDGKFLVSGGFHDNGLAEIRLWDAYNGKPVRRFSTGTGHLFEFTLSPDGKYLAVGDSRTGVHVLEAATGKKRYSLSGKQNYISSWSFSPDGREFVVAWPYEARLHFRDPHTGKPLRTWDMPEENAFRPTFSPDGKLLATTGGSGVIRLWDTATGAPVRQLRGNDPWIEAMVFSPDSRRLAAITYRSGTVFVWDTTTGTRLSTVAGHDLAVTALTFARDGRRLFSHGADGRLLSWDWASGAESFLFRASPDMSGGSCALGPDAAVLVTQGNGVAHCWDFRGDGGLRTLGQQLLRYQGSPLVLSPDGSVLAASQRETDIFLGETATGAEVGVLKGHTKDVWGLAFAPDGRTLASVSSDGTVRLWDTRTKKEIRAWRTGEGMHVRLAFAPDGKILAVVEGAHGDSIRLWDVATAQETTPPLRHGGCSALAFSADGRFLATGGYDPLKLWETATGQLVFDRKGHHSGVQCLAFAPDDRVLASGGGDSTILVWDLTGRMDGTRLRPLRLTEAEADALWEALLGPAPVAIPAAWRLVAAPAQALPLLKQRLRPAPDPPPSRLDQLLSDLASDRFAERQAAMRDLEGYGELAVPAMRAAVAKSPPLEVSRRLEQLLAKCGPGAVPSGERLRALRALLVLEHIDSPEARALLRALAGGAAAARLTREARAALERLNRP